MAGINSEGLIAAFALIFSVASFYVNYVVTLAAKRQDLTIEIWKAWISADYRNFRVRASRKIRDCAGCMRYSVIAADPEDELAVGSVERFIIDAACAYRQGLVNRPLFDAFFSSTLQQWRQGLAEIDRDTEESRRFCNEIKWAFKVLLDGNFAATVDPT